MRQRYKKDCERNVSRYVRYHAVVANYHCTVQLVFDFLIIAIAAISVVYSVTYSVAAQIPFTVFATAFANELSGVPSARVFARDTYSPDDGNHPVLRVGAEERTLPDSGTSGVTPANGAASLSPTTFVPAPTLSPLERAFSARAGTHLTLFGHNLFQGSRGGGRGQTAPAPAGAFQDDLLLGAGDELHLILRGGTRANRRYVINPEGRLVVDELKPIAAAGRTLRAVRAELEEAVRTGMRDTEAVLSLAAVRRIGVLVVGEVAHPGRHDVTAQSSVLDALIAAGGIERSGSLRQIRLTRPGTSAPQHIDLYELLLGGGRSDEVRLRDGDRLLVPPLGPTLAVAGAVRRPGIYELRPEPAPPGYARLSLPEVRELVGGVVRPGIHRWLRLGIAADGRELAEEITLPEAEAGAGTNRSAHFGDGDLLQVVPAREERVGVVTLDGHVQHPGPRARTSAGSVRQLVGLSDLREGPYLPFAVLERTDLRTRGRALHAFDLGAVLHTRQNQTLHDDDTVIVLGQAEIDFLSSRPVLTLLKGGRLSEADTRNCAGLGILARTLAADPHGELASGPVTRAAAALSPEPAPCPALFDRYPDLLRFVLAQSVLRRSGVARPGLYPVAENATATTRAGQAARSPVHAALPQTALPQTAAVTKGGVVDSTAPRFELTGHVRHPGTRPLGADTRLRKILDREALSPGVYPLFAVIDRFDARTLNRHILPFSPQEVIAGQLDRRLLDHDRVILLSTRAVTSFVAAEIAQNKANARHMRIKGDRVYALPADESVDINYSADRVNDKEERSEKKGRGEKNDRNMVGNTRGEGRGNQSRAPATARLERDDPTHSPAEGEGGTADPAAWTDNSFLAVADALPPLPGVGIAPPPPVISGRRPPLLTGARVLSDDDGEALDDPAIAAVVRENLVRIEGAVRLPGAYPVAGAIPVPALIAVAGGLTRQADASRLEVITTPNSATSRHMVALAAPETQGVLVQAGGQIRVPGTPVAPELQTVQIRGEVRHPGPYTLGPGDTLGTVLARAGGLTADAYPEGAVFTRDSIRRREAETRLQMARELEHGLAQKIRRGTAPRTEDMSLVRQMVGELRGAAPLGRMVVKADPAVLKVRPELDVLLEGGDTLHIPKRPGAVIVSGEVRAPAALAFDPRKSIDDYLREAGGLTHDADQDRAFVVMPDGSSQPLTLPAWAHLPLRLPPGAAIVVPRDPEPLGGFDFTRDLRNFMRQLALAAVPLAALLSE